MAEGCHSVDPGLQFPFFAVWGGRPQAAIQCIRFFVASLLCTVGCRRLPLSISRWSFLLCCLWWATEGSHLAHPGLYFHSSLCTAGGRRPPFRISRFGASFFAVHGGWPKAAIQYTQVYIVLAVYGGRPKAAIQHIQVCICLLRCVQRAAEGHHSGYPGL